MAERLVKERTGEVVKSSDSWEKGGIKWEKILREEHGKQRLLKSLSVTDYISIRFRGCSLIRREEDSSHEKRLRDVHQCRTMAPARSVRVMEPPLVVKISVFLD